MASHLDAQAFKRLVRLVCALALVASAVAISGAAAAPQQVLKAPAGVPDFGPNVKIFDPSMSTSEIKAAVDAIAAEQVSNQFGTQRYALLFMPGTYGSAADPLNFQVGYYTEVAGLGSSPSDVIVNGTIDVYNQCFGPGDCTALVNFWRSVSNLTINVAGKGGCQSGEFWATSQAAPMRRVHVNGFTTLMDYCTAPSFASGGFIADSQFSRHRRQRLAAAVPGAEQQRRRLERTASGTRSSPASRARPRRRSRARRTRRSPRTPRRARSRSSTSTRTGTSTSSSPTRVQLLRARRGPTARHPATRSRSRSFFIAKPDRQRPVDQQRARRAARTSSSPPASTTSTRRSR